jgi:hypothetical protein
VKCGAGEISPPPTLSSAHLNVVIFSHHQRYVNFYVFGSTYGPHTDKKMKEMASDG